MWCVVWEGVWGEGSYRLERNLRWVGMASSKPASKASAPSRVPPASSGSVQAGPAGASRKDPGAAKPARAEPVRRPPAPAPGSSRGGPGRIALVTGAASGIGQAAAIGLAKAGHHVVLLVRSEARGREAMAGVRQVVPSKELEVLVCDLASQAWVRAAAAAFHARHDHLDVLVNCAGVFLPDKRITGDGVEATLASNHVGHALLTELMMAALERAPAGRVVSVASRYGRTAIDFTDMHFARRKFSYLKAVPQSKLAQVLWTQELAAQLKARGSKVTVNAVHPGLVANTKLLGQTGGFFRFVTNRLGGTPEEGADTVVWLATSPEAAGQSGLLWEKRKPMKTPGQGSDPAARKRLWDETQMMIRA